jgi:hypothetical protein
MCGSVWICFLRQSKKNFFKKLNIFVNNKVWAYTDNKYNVIYITLYVIKKSDTIQYVAIIQIVQTSQEISDDVSFSPLYLVINFLQIYKRDVETGA